MHYIFSKSDQLRSVFASVKNKPEMYKSYVELKVKVKLSLFLTKHHAMKTYWGSGVIAPRIIVLGTRWR
jgi:hypothetical protein